VCASPQLDETFSVGLSSHSTPPSRIGHRREVNITVRSSDDPYGVIQFSQSGLAEAINESKGSETHQGTEVLQVLLRDPHVNDTLLENARDRRNIVNESQNATTQNESRQYFVGFSI
jgi:hypothetical protein